MKRMIVPAVLTASFAFVPAVYAASQMATGMVKSYDATVHSVTLQDGVTYWLPSTFKDPGIKAGEKVEIEWAMKDAKHEASTLKIVQ
ncbi:MAG: DUF1344 domain-containing protein [Nitratireductor sp.]|nr:DUF1344 domain-containing protein [Nitratireductor sp.]